MTSDERIDELRRDVFAAFEAAVDAGEPAERAAEALLELAVRVKVAVVGHDRAPEAINSAVRFVTDALRREAERLRSLTPSMN
jgi:hypothetical protein